MNRDLSVRNLPATSVIHAAERPGWRDKGKAKGRPASGTGSDAPDWSRQRGQPNWDGAASRTLGLVVLGVAIPALVFAFYLLLPDHRVTPLLVISVTDYDSPVPPNAFAIEDTKRMQTVFDQAKYDNINLLTPNAPQDSSDLLEIVEAYLKDVEPGGPGKDIALIYLSAHGFVNSDGEPCLLLPEQDPLDSSTWTSVAKLLEAIDKSSRSRKFKTVLMFDATRIDDAWRFGVFANTFSVALESYLKDSPLDNCLVLNASTGLETALAAPEMSGTAFGHFATNGLRGAADTNDDDEITLGELEQYLRHHVDSWAKSHRAVHQRPVLFHANDVAKRLKLVYVAREAKNLHSMDPWSPNDQADEELWTRVTMLESTRPCMHSPLRWARLQFLIERYDALLMAGSAYSAVATDTFESIEKLLKELEQAKSIRYPNPISLAMRRRLAGTPDSQAMTEAWNAWVEDPAAATALPEYGDAADFLWQRSTNDETIINRQELVRGLEFCKAAGEPKQAEYFEIALLRILKQHADWNALNRSGESTLWKLLRATELSQQLAATADPRAHYLIATALEAADLELSSALDHVLTGNGESLRAAERILDNLLSDGEGSYAAIKRQSDGILRALGNRDEAFATVLHLSQFVARRGRFDKAYRETKADGNLVSFAKHTTELADLLDRSIEKSGGSDPPLDRISDYNKAVEDRGDTIFGEYAKRVRAIRPDEQGSKQDLWVETHHLLRCPINFGNARQDLRSMWFDQLGSGSAESPSVATDDSTALEVDLGYLGWLARDGLAPLEHLLDWRGIVGDEGFGPTEFTLSTDQQDSKRAADELARLGGLLREHLRELRDTAAGLRKRSVEAATEQYASKARRGYALGDRIERGLAPLISGTWTDNDDLQLIDTQALALWHGDRFLDAFWGQWQVGPPYFETAAEYQAKLAEDIVPTASYGPQQLRARIASSLNVLAEWVPLTSGNLSYRDNSMLKHEVSYEGHTGIPPGFVSVYVTRSDGEALPPRENMRMRREQSSSRSNGRELGFQIDPSAISNQNRLSANALFRGHVKTTNFGVGRGVSVVWNKPPPSGASIVVKGDENQISQIIFIVDCSASMRDSDLRKGEAAISEILDILMDRRGEYRVGLVLYGHRARFAKNKGDSLDKVKIVGPPTVHPNSDVEIVMEPKKLDNAHAADLRARLRILDGKGQTPLYLAFSDALRAFSAPVKGPRHVIAITDGDNELYVPTRFRTRATSLTKVEQENLSVGAIFDVLEFGENSDDRDNLAEFAVASGGSFKQIGDAGDLANRIEEKLRLDRYSLEPTVRTGNIIPKVWRELGTPTTYEARQLPLDFRVLLEQHNPEEPRGRLEGGEALELVYSKSTNRQLSYRRFETDGPGIGETREVGDYRITPLVPGRNTNQVVFRVAIQNSDTGQFTRRPEVVWAKVTPLGDRRAKSHFFVDRQFQRRQFVPIFEFTANEWGRESRARIELCFADQAPTIKSYALSEPVNDIPGVKLAVNVDRTDEHPMTITVEGEHAEQINLADKFPTYPLHIQLRPQPDRIERTYYEAERRFLYVFHYLSESRDPILQILSREDIEASGVRSAELQIEVPN